MLQEVYIRIIRGLKTFDETRPLLPWLKRVTVNTLINQSKKKRVTETSLEGNWSTDSGSVDNTNPDSYLTDETNLEEQVICSDTSKIIDQLIAELPEIYRISLTLRYYENMSYDEIAALVEQPLGTVKNSVYRARKILRQKMQACELLEV